jgi:hypothetical protein
MSLRPDAEAVMLNRFSRALIRMPEFLLTAQNKSQAVCAHDTHQKRLSGPSFLGKEE